jgi:PAS domain S-box-containing protein
VQIAYSSTEVRQLIISLLVVSFGIYAYQESRERLEHQTKAAERNLRAEKIRAVAIVQNIGEGVVATDEEGFVASMNRAAERILGWSAHELIGKNFITSIPMRDEAGNAIPLERRPLELAQKGKSTELVAVYQRKDGSQFPVAVVGTPVIIDGKEIGGVVAFRDITKEQEADRTKSEFVTLVSHQLRTPLSAVSWFSEMLLNGDAGELTPEQRDHVEKIHLSNQRMAALVGEMLIVSGLELGSLHVIVQPTNLLKLTRSVVKEQKDFYFERKPRIVEHYEEDLPELLLDAEIMKTLLRNIVSNALKYTPGDGSIAITVKRTSERLTIGSKGSVVVAVTDTGYGVPEDVRDKVFSKFFRAENVKQRDTDGTGLGLYIVKSLLDYVGGTVGFISTEGLGTTVTLMLPLEGMGGRGSRPDTSRSFAKHIISGDR